MEHNVRNIKRWFWIWKECCLTRGWKIQDCDKVGMESSHTSTALNLYFIYQTPVKWNEFVNLSSGTLIFNPTLIKLHVFKALCWHVPLVLVASKSPQPQLFVVAGANLAFESLGDSLGPCEVRVPYMPKGFLFFLTRVILRQADICSDVCLCVYRAYLTCKDLKRSPLETAGAIYFSNQIMALIQLKVSWIYVFLQWSIRQTKNFEAEIGFPSLHQNCGEIFRAPVLQMCCNKMTANAMRQIDLFAMKMFGILV